jgi:hypothetical protein
MTRSRPARGGLRAPRPIANNPWTGDVGSRDVVANSAAIPPASARDAVARDLRELSLRMDRTLGRLFNNLFYVKKYVTL